ncbi:MAG TPA: hypothetical protein VFJ02_12360 [Vicinamibacterales bacterium]|nr:hypothetical protein [Vicinamibacterales bacterium]
MAADGNVIDYLGWLATAVFVSSYFCSRPEALTRVQMVGALMWIVYGVLIGASPVVVANLLVFAAAAWTTARIARTRAGRQPAPNIAPDAAIE